MAAMIQSAVERCNQHVMLLDGYSRFSRCDAEDLVQTFSCGCVLRIIKSRHGCLGMVEGVALDAELAQSHGQAHRYVASCGQSNHPSTHKT